jgi:futalosine hydrolase
VTASRLLLVPTAREARLLLGSRARRGVPLVLTGLGLAEAGAAAGRAFAERQPGRALLVGLAGTLDPSALPVGALLLATSVACDGIGAGEGTTFVTLAGPRIGLASLSPKALVEGATRGELLSVAAAAGSPEMARARRRRHPDALAEEMEGYAVARAAKLARVKLAILRAVCNVAGDRDHAGWRMGEALRRCRDLVRRWIEAGAS